MDKVKKIPYSIAATKTYCRKRKRCGGFKEKGFRFQKRQQGQFKKGAQLQKVQ